MWHVTTEIESPPRNPTDRQPIHASDQVLSHALSVHAVLLAVAVMKRQSLLTTKEIDSIRLSTVVTHTA